METSETDVGVSEKVGFKNNQMNMANIFGLKNRCAPEKKTLNQ